MISIKPLKSSDFAWSSLIAHLQRTGDAAWVLTDENYPLPSHHFLAALIEQSVIGSLTLKLQDIVSPETPWSTAQHLDHQLRRSDGTTYQESFVQTFTVEKKYRRQGIGTALQRAALSLTQELGVYQMRSWSSLDKPANYALKLSLGFAVHPEIQKAARTGQVISGVYFIKVVQPLES